MSADQGMRLGWIGIGRMGRVLATRLLDAGHELGVYNRTREKADPLAELGATIVDSPAELADRDIVFTMVAGSADVEEVVSGPAGLLSRDLVPRVIVDSTTISPAVAETIRAAAESRGSAMLAAPVSGNPKVAASGRLTIVTSGPREAWLQAQPYLERLARTVTYVGEGERARLVKICHNLMLGVVAQCMAEITVLAEKGGVARADFLEFLNDSVMGSTFTRYKSPAYVNLDFTPTFTPSLLLKDFQLGFEAANATRRADAARCDHRAARAGDGRDQRRRGRFRRAARPPGAGIGTRARPGGRRGRRRARADRPQHQRRRSGQPGGCRAVALVQRSENPRAL